MTSCQDYEFKGCDEAGCPEPATYIAIHADDENTGSTLVAYCEKHGQAHRLSRGIPAGDSNAAR